MSLLLFMVSGEELIGLYQKRVKKLRAKLAVQDSVRAQLIETSEETQTDETSSNSNDSDPVKYRFTQMKQEAFALKTQIAQLEWKAAHLDPKLFYEIPVESNFGNTSLNEVLSLVS